MTAKYDLKDKSESLASKMNRLTKTFTDNLEVADEMIITGSDVIEYVEEKTQIVKLYTDTSELNSEVLNLNNMVDDFKYVRETLKENTDNARRVLSSITLSLLEEDDDKRAGLVMSFAELNRSITDNMKLYIQSYKDISNVLLNLEKIKSGEVPPGPQSVTNNLTINTPIAVSTMDLIKQLGNKNV